jgi:hypothetical protein
VGLKQPCACCGVGATAGARSLIAESVEGLAPTLQRLHADRGLTIDLQLSPGHAPRVDREDLDEMLGNILDNACKWATSRAQPDLSPRGVTQFSAVPRPDSPDRA